MNKTLKPTQRLLLATLVVALCSVANVLAQPKIAMAVSGADFQAGRIIDDEVFNNANSMTSGQIQDFLNAKMPHCDNWGTKPYAGTTRRAYSEARGIKFPLVCLKDYRENPSTHANNLEGRGIPAGAKSAAQIIYDAGQRHSINPQVLLVLLQKEQALVLDDWPWPLQYQGATGYGCPDTAECNSDYYGFYNQVENAARQFRRYAQYPNSYGHVAGVNNQVRFNPNASCGTSTVFIRNQATASLYNYTPYQPNAAALANLYGTGDGCSAYGNRNFWRYFNDWFGSTFMGDSNKIFNIKKTNFGTTQQLLTATSTQLFLNSWWNGGNGIHRDLVTNSPLGERIVDFDKITEADGVTQTAYIATSSGVYKAQWSGSTFNPPVKVINRPGTKKILLDTKDEGGNLTYRLYVLANDGPYEYWWRNGTNVSDGYRFWNINNGLDIVKSTDPTGKDEVFVATKGEVYMMRWPLAGGAIERRQVNTLANTVGIDKQTINGTELLYTATKTGVHETWWNQSKPAGWFSNSAKIAHARGGQEVVDVQKKFTNGYHQLYMAENGYVKEYWWGPNSNGVQSGQLVHISQNSIVEIDKTTTASYQNLYTASQSFIYETWWGNGRFGNGPAIINLGK